MNHTAQRSKNQIGVEFDLSTEKGPKMRTIMNILSIAVLAASVPACALEPEPEMLDTAQAVTSPDQSLRPAATFQGCPDGYVCVYPQNKGYNGGVPSLRFFTYGPHNLSNQFGTHRVLNNQTGGAIALFCNGFNGVDCPTYLPAGWVVDINLTPINSIDLEPHL
jgi:hypothetical protein